MPWKQPGKLRFRYLLRSGICRRSASVSTQRSRLAGSYHRNCPSSSRSAPRPGKTTVQDASWKRGCAEYRRDGRTSSKATKANKTKRFIPGRLSPRPPQSTKANCRSSATNNFLSSSNRTVESDHYCFDTELKNAKFHSSGNGTAQAFSSRSAWE